MIANVFLYLVAAGFAAEISARSRYDRFWSLMSFAAVSTLLLIFFDAWMSGEQSRSLYRWIDGRYNPVDLVFSGSSLHNAVVFPFFVLTAVSLLNNTLSAQESSKMRLNGLMIFSLAGLILLISAENSVQLLAGVLILDVLSLWSVRDVDAKTKYAFYSLLADSFIFASFALIWGQTGNFGLQELEHYGERGGSSGLVMALLLFGTFIKSGLFLFHNYLYDLSGLSFNRLIFLSLCSTPAAGVILLWKIYPVLQGADWGIVLIRGFAVLSVVWGFWNSVAMDSIKEKAVSYNLMFYGFVFGLFSVGGMAAIRSYPSLLLAVYLLNAVLMLAVRSASNEIYVSNMGGFAGPLKITFALTLAVVYVLAQTVLREMNGGNVCWTGGFAGAILLSLSVVLRQIYLEEAHADERVWALLKNASLFYFLPLLLMAGGLMYTGGWYVSGLDWLFGCFLLLLFSGPFRFLERLYQNDALQEADYFSEIYDWIFVAPVKILGRILWLTIDFLIIERTIISSLSNSTSFLTYLSGKMHTGTKFSGIMFTLLGLGIIAAVFYAGGDK